MRPPKVGLSVLPEEDLRLAQLPLFAAGLVDAIEWTIDAEFEGVLPSWVEPLLDHYASCGVLYGHGVQFSPLSGLFEARQARWLEQASRVLAKRPYRQLSEHFGFTTVPGLARSAPLPVPFVPRAVAIGRDRLRSLQDAAAGTCVGLENLALSMSRTDVLMQGEFLDQLLEPTNGFLLLDLHNLHCQSENFDVAADELVLSMPLERVREIHVSGGSWSSVSTPDGPRPFRRDTHDDAIPEAVFSLLGFTLARCPLLEVVFVERLGKTLNNPVDVARYRADYERVRSIVAAAGQAGG
ncbi:MAG: DUF692 family multinuclear iron-containing protein [Deltaproteobacteria bacterium]